MFRRINITLSEETLARADEFASRQRYTRSGLIAAALDAFVAEPSADHRVTAEEARAAYAPRTAPERPVGLGLAEVTAALRGFFSARDDVEAAWVFGSVARGTASPESDVDVAVLPREPRSGDSWRLRSELISRLPGALGVREVDVVVLPDASVQLGFEIADEGVLVFGEGSRVGAEAMMAAMSDYWDSQPVRSAARVALGERMRGYAESE